MSWTTLLLEIHIWKLNNDLRCMLLLKKYVWFFYLTISKNRFSHILYSLLKVCVRNSEVDLHYQDFFPFTACVSILTSLKKESLYCSARDSCLALDCCADVNEIGQKLHFDVDFDICHNMININIENVNHSISLFDYNYGTLKEVSLAGVVTLR